MEFLARLKAYIEDQKLFQPHEKVLLAVSGGVDSVVLHHALHKLGYTIGIAHCNFQLRGEESDQEEQFVSDLARIINAPFFVRKFDTKQASESSKLSIQMAARELRYAWFEELRAEHHYSCIAVAHHQNDVLETVLLNLVRGTGIAGFHGILPLNGHVVRPLLFATRQEIEAYAKEYQLVWCEDSSNASNKYARNLIRNEVIPLLKQINPSLEKTIKQTVEKISIAETQVNAIVETKKKELLIWKNGIAQINIQTVQKEPSSLFVLSSILKEFGFEFSTCKQILDSANGISGKSFVSVSHVLIKDRENWLIKINEKKLIHFTLFSETESVQIDSEKVLKIELIDYDSQVLAKLKAQKKLFFDYAKVEFPLNIRVWQNGDVIEPFGMKGSKKVSDLLIDAKMSLLEKQQTLVLESQGKILSVLGVRNSRHYLVDDSTKRIWIAELTSSH